MNTPDTSAKLVVLPASLTTLSVNRLGQTIGQDELVKQRLLLIATLHDNIDSLKNRIAELQASGLSPADIEILSKELRRLTQSLWRNG